MSTITVLGIVNSCNNIHFKVYIHARHNVPVLLEKIRFARNIGLCCWQKRLLPTLPGTNVAENVPENV